MHFPISHLFLPFASWNRIVWLALRKDLEYFYRNKQLTPRPTFLKTAAWQRANSCRLISATSISTETRPQERIWTKSPTNIHGSVRKVGKTPLARLLNPAGLQRVSSEGVCRSAGGRWMWMGRGGGGGVA